MTAVHRIVNGSYLECASPQLPEAVEWWRENASEPAAAGAFAEASAPGGGGYGSGGGGGALGADVRFDLAHNGSHCCAAGAGAALVGIVEPAPAAAACEAACPAQPSCRFFAHRVGGGGECALCSSCEEPTAADGGAWSSWARVEPPLSPLGAPPAVGGMDALEPPRRQWKSEVLAVGEAWQRVIKRAGTNLPAFLMASELAKAYLVPIVAGYWPALAMGRLPVLALDAVTAQP